MQNNTKLIHWYNRVLNPSRAAQFDTNENDTLPIVPFLSQNKKKTGDSFHELNPYRYPMYVH
jgi:hypothetical protein